MKVQRSLNMHLAIRGRQWDNDALRIPAAAHEQMLRQG
jgi:hypothetical protein